MTVAELKAYLNNYDDRAEVFYFDSEQGLDIPFNTAFLTIRDLFEDVEEADKEQSK